MAVLAPLLLGIAAALLVVRCAPYGGAAGAPPATANPLPATVARPLPAHYRKLDPALRSLITAPATVLPAGHAQNNDRLWVLVYGTAAVRTELRRIGATVAARANSGSPYVARLAVSDLVHLAAIPGVAYIEASRPNRPVVDVSVPATGAVQAWRLSAPSSQPLTGHGVLIAVVDTGADWSHPDLRNADGTTRILHLLDQTCGVSGYKPCATTGTVSTAGREWAASDINGWLKAGQRPGHVVDTGTGASLPDDTFPGAKCDVAAGCGHGTHVASVAAGNGYSHGTRTFRGVAPDADLLIVRSDLQSASIMRAWSWIVAKAKALGKPVVINNAFGFDFGPHDGTDSLEQELDRLSGSGVIFVVAAGNAAAARKHASGTVADGTPSKFAFQLDAEGQGGFSLWYASTEHWEFRLTQAGVAERARVRHGKTATVSVQDSGATTTVTVDATAAPHAKHTTLNQLTVTMSRQSGGQRQSGAWIGELHRVSGSSTVRWDAWTTTGELTFFKTGTLGMTGGWDATRTLTEPANATRAVTVAAYTTRLTWPCDPLPTPTPTLPAGVTPTATSTATATATAVPSCTGSLVNSTTPTPVSGSVAHFSSRGPTRDGREKPDVTAPGEPIIGARALRVPTPDPQAPYASEHQVMRQGTSLAAAHVTGATALLLQINPLLTPEEVAALLRATARRDQFTAAHMGTATPWSAPWGAGKLHVVTAAQTAIATTPTATPTPTDTPVHSPTPTNTPTPRPEPTDTPTPTASVPATPTKSVTKTPTPTPDPAVSATPVVVLVGELRWHHRAEPPHPGHRTNVTVRFYPVGSDPGSRSARFTVTTSTDDYGRFAVSLRGVRDEVFDINVKPDGGLSREKRGVRLRWTASVSVRFGGVSEGDLDGNDRIDAHDAAVLRSHFGRFAGESGYTVTADFDRDGRITVLDWSHIARSQGRRGPELVF